VLLFGCMVYRFVEVIACGRTGRYALEAVRDRACRQCFRARYKSIGSCRVNIESIWLPSVLCGDRVSWTESDTSRPQARFIAHGETARIDYVVDENGRLKAVSMPRWGNPDGPEFRYVNCGGFVEREGRFGGYIIPTHMRVGPLWH